MALCSLSKTFAMIFTLFHKTQIPPIWLIGSIWSKFPNPSVWIILLVLASDTIVSNKNNKSGWCVFTIKWISCWIWCFLEPYTFHARPSLKSKKKGNCWVPNNPRPRAKCYQKADLHSYIIRPNTCNDVSIQKYVATNHIQDPCIKPKRAKPGKLGATCSIIEAFKHVPMWSKNVSMQSKHRVVHSKHIAILK